MDIDLFVTYTLCIFGGILLGCALGSLYWQYQRNKDYSVSLKDDIELTPITLPYKLEPNHKITL